MFHGANWIWRFVLPWLILIMSHRKKVFMDRARPYGESVVQCRARTSCVLRRL